MTLIGTIYDDNGKIQSLLRCLKRSNSEYVKFRPLTRMRTQSNDEDEKFKNGKVIPMTP